MKKMLAFKKQLEEKKLDDLRKKENEGISWGMGEDAEDDEEEEEEEKVTMNYSVKSITT